MTRKLLSGLAALAVAATLAPSAFASAGIYDPFAIVNGNFYDLGATTALPDYQGSFLGTFTTSDSILLGGQQKSFKNNGTDVLAHTLDWRIWSGAPSGTFNGISYAFQWNNGDSGAPGNLNNPGDQQWGTNVEGANGTNQAFSISLNSLAPGTYTLELFSFITTNGTDSGTTIFNNNGGANYLATFTIIPEPSTLSLLAAPAILGAVFFMRRRRG